MRYSRWTLRSAVAVTAGLAVAAGLPAGLAAAQSNAGGPMVKLVVAQKNVNVPRFGKRVFLDSGVYVTAVGSPLQFDVQRANYAKPITITQVFRAPGGQITKRPLPAWTLAKNWSGLRRFFRMTVKNLAGKTSCLECQLVLPE